MAKLVSKTYGEALFEIAVEEGTVDTLYDEVEQTLVIFRDNSEYVKLLNHPKLSAQKKASMIEEAFRGRVSDALTGLLVTVVQKGRFAEVEQVLLYFEQRVREYKKIGTAYVTSAQELDAQQKDSIQKRLLETTSYRSFDIHYRVDGALIGGIVIQIGDRVVDASIRTKLANMARDLSEIQLA